VLLASVGNVGWVGCGFGGLTGLSCRIVGVANRIDSCWYGIREAFESWHIEPQFEGTCNDLWYASPPAHHGYYYFRPYNYRHVTAYSQDASRMGNDPAMPFSNEVFRRRYARKPEAMPQGSGWPNALPHHSAPLWQHSKPKAPRSK